MTIVEYVFVRRTKSKTKSKCPSDDENDVSTSYNYGKEAVMLFRVIKVRNTFMVIADFWTCVALLGSS